MATRFTKGFIANIQRRLKRAPQNKVARELARQANRELGRKVIDIPPERKPQIIDRRTKKAPVTQEEKFIQDRLVAGGISESARQRLQTRLEELKSDQPLQTFQTSTGRTVQARTRAAVEAQLAREAAATSVAGKTRTFTGVESEVDRQSLPLEEFERRERQRRILREAQPQLFRSTFADIRKIPERAPPIRPSGPVSFVSEPPPKAPFLLNQAITDRDLQRRQTITPSPPLQIRDRPEGISTEKVVTGLKIGALLPGAAVGLIGKEVLTKKVSPAIAFGKEVSKDFQAGEQILGTKLFGGQAIRFEKLTERAKKAAGQTRVFEKIVGAGVVIGGATLISGALRKPVSTAASLFVAGKVVKAGAAAIKGGILVGARVVAGKAATSPVFQARVAGVARVGSLAGFVAVPTGIQVARAEGVKGKIAAGVGGLATTGGFLLVAGGARRGAQAASTLLPGGFKTTVKPSTSKIVVTREGTGRARRVSQTSRIFLDPAGKVTRQVTETRRAGLFFGEKKFVTVTTPERTVTSKVSFFGKLKPETVSKTPTTFGKETVKLTRVGSPQFSLERGLSQPSEQIVARSVRRVDQPRTVKASFGQSARLDLKGIARQDVLVTGRGIKGKGQIRVTELKKAVASPGSLSEQITRTQKIIPRGAEPGTQATKSQFIRGRTAFQPTELVVTEVSPIRSGVRTTELATRSTTTGIQTTRQELTFTAPEVVEVSKIKVSGGIKFVETLPRRGEGFFKKVGQVGQKGLGFVDRKILLQIRARENLLPGPVVRAKDTALGLIERKIVSPVKESFTPKTPQRVLISPSIIPLTKGGQVAVQKTKSFNVTKATAKVGVKRPTPESFKVKDVPFVGVTQVPATRVQTRRGLVGKTESFQTQKPGVIPQSKAGLQQAVPQATSLKTQTKATQGFKATTKVSVQQKQTLRLRQRTSQRLKQRLQQTQKASLRGGRFSFSSTTRVPPAPKTPTFAIPSAFDQRAFREKKDPFTQKTKKRKFGFAPSVEALAFTITGPKKTGLGGIGLRRIVR